MIIDGKTKSSPEMIPYLRESKQKPTEKKQEI